MEPITSDFLSEDYHKQVRWFFAFLLFNCPEDLLEVMANNLRAFSPAAREAFAIVNALARD